MADSDVGVLIRGESGVGKELVSRAIHQRSTRRNRPFVKVNCAALPAELLESELFGHERGAFTGAANTRIGKFEQADTGTLMLDEIGEMKPALQAKLLHVLQDGEFTKLGSNKRVQVDVRVVAATNRDLEKMMLSGDFREDLYYRLKVIELTVPPLRERPDEIPTLIDFFIARYARKYNRPARPLTEPLRQLFMQYEWPGNIRELENMIKRVVILQDEQLVIREIERNMQRAVASAAAAAAAAQPRRWRDAGRHAAAIRRCRRCRTRRPVAGAAGRTIRPTSDDAARTSQPRSSRRRIAGGGRQGGVDESRARRDRADAAAGALEPPQGRADSRRELQDAAQQDQGMRHLAGCELPPTVSTALPFLRR